MYSSYNIKMQIIGVYGTAYWNNLVFIAACDVRISCDDNLPSYQYQKNEGKM